MGDFNGLLDLSVIHTDLEVYDACTAFLKKQKSKSRVPHSSNCLYYGEGKKKCAVGAFIPQSCYSSEIEGRTLYSLMAWFDRTEHTDMYQFLERHYDVLARLQDIHDNVYPWLWAGYFTYYRSEYFDKAGTYHTTIVN